MREGILALMQHEKDFSLIAAELKETSLPILENFNPDVVLIDYTLQEEFNLFMIDKITETLPSAQLIIMDLAPIHPEIIDYVKSGVSGFVLKGASLDEFKNTIRKVATGKKVLPAPLIGTLFAQIVSYGIKKETALKKEGVSITKREQEVIGLISQGLRNKEIANNLNLSVDTIKSHVHNILEKLSLENRTQIASYMHAYKDF